MPPAPRLSPFDGTERLIIDGTNLLYRLGAGAGGPAPASAIVGRIRGAVPMTIAIDLVFDGIGHGIKGRLAQKMIVRYSGRHSADDLIVDLVSEAAVQGGGPAAADKVLVATNDRELRDKLAAKGARTAPLQWLISRLDVPLPAPGTGAGGRAKGSSIGHGRPPKGPSGSPDGGSDDRPGWKSGRGATAKTGAPKKVARHKRKPRTRP